MEDRWTRASWISDKLTCRSFRRLLFSSRHSCAQTVCLYTQTETIFYCVCSQSDVSPLNKSTAQSQQIRHFALGIGESPGAPCSAVVFV